MAARVLKNIDAFFGKAKEFNNKYLRAQIHAVEQYDSPRQGQVRINEFLSRESQWDFKATNPYSNQIWFEGLINSYLNSNLIDMRPEGQRYGESFYKCAMITFTHRDWVCTDVDIKFDLAKAKRMVRKALPGLTYIACFEIAYYTNEEWEKDGKVGNLVSFHCHAIVWALSSYKIKQARMKAKGRFQPILGNNSGMRVDTLKSAEDVCNVIRYQTKMPFYGYKTVIVGAKRRQKKSRLSNLQNYRLLKALGTYEVLDLWFAGGKGAQLMANARSDIAKLPRKKLTRKDYKHAGPDRFRFYQM